MTFNESAKEMERRGIVDRLVKNESELKAGATYYSREYDRTYGSFIKTYDKDFNEVETVKMTHCDAIDSLKRIAPSVFEGKVAYSMYRFESLGNGYSLLTSMGL